MDAPPTISLMGVPLHAVSQRDAVAHVDQSLRAGVGGWVLTPNLDILRRLVRDPEFAQRCAGVTMRVADGMPLIWASRLAGMALPERVAGSDLIWLLCERASTSGHHVFLLGGEEGTADRAAEILKSRNPGLIVAGTVCPPFGFEHDEAYLAALETRLIAASPDIVFVALGSPKQENLIDRLRHRLPAAWFLGIGISFSFVCGDVQRAPAWMRHAGLEWAHRLAQEPGRLARRYLVDGIPFGVHLLLVSALSGLRSTRGPVPTRTETPAARVDGYRKAG